MTVTEKGFINYRRVQWIRGGGGGGALPLLVDVLTSMVKDPISRLLQFFHRTRANIIQIFPRQGYHFKELSLVQNYFSWAILYTRSHVFQVKRTS